MKLIVSILLTGLLALLKSPPTVPSQPLSWSVISSFSLTSTSGTKEKINASRLNVFVMLSPECPLCKNYVRVVNQLHNRNPKVKFYGIIPGKAYTAETIAHFGKEYKAEFPLLIDPEKKLSKYLKATVTPESVLIDNTGEIKYRGLIDNWAVSLGQQRQVTTEHYLANAIQSIKDNNEIIRPYTRPVGCKINDL